MPSLAQPATTSFVSFWGDCGRHVPHTRHMCNPMSYPFQVQWGSSEPDHACMLMHGLPPVRRPRDEARTQHEVESQRPRRDVVPTTGAKQSRIRGCFNAGYKVLAYHVAYYISYHMECSGTIR